MSATHSEQDGEKGVHAPNTLKAFISAPRYARYSDNDTLSIEEATRLYIWNLSVSQALIPFLHFWEIGLRNRLSAFFTYKYGKDWIYNDNKIIRNLPVNIRSILIESRCRQQANLGHGTKPSQNAIIADTSAAFWALQFQERHFYHNWKYNLRRVFPYIDRIEQTDVNRICQLALTLRNRIAHHEPIYRLDLTTQKAEIYWLIAAMCPDTAALAARTSDFDAVFSAGPRPLPHPRDPC